MESVMSCKVQKKDVEINQIHLMAATRVSEQKPELGSGVTAFSWSQTSFKYISSKATAIRYPTLTTSQGKS